MNAAGMETVLWIAGVGMTLLMLALGGLVALMYLMTSPVFGRAAVAASPPHMAFDAVDDGERDRRRHAAALAVAIAAADMTAPLAREESASAWRHIHRAARLRPRTVRKGGRL